MQILRILLYFLVILCVSGQNGTSECNEGASKTKLTWENGACLPAALCNGVVLNEIPNFPGNLPGSLLCRGSGASSSAHAPIIGRLYDRNATRQCFNGKKLCVLGDSTIEETIHDIIFLLSGIGPDMRKIIDYCIAVRAASTPRQFRFDDVDISLQGSGGSGDRAHRLMSVTVPGINSNGGGVSGLLYALSTLFQTSLADCDILLMQSASHDHQRCSYEAANMTGICLEEYIEGVRALPVLLETLFTDGLNSKGKKIEYYWKGEALVAHNSGDFVSVSTKKALEERVHNILRAAGPRPITSSRPDIRFINLTDALLQLPAMKHARVVHIGQNSKVADSPTPLLWSSVSTQVVLNSLCGKS
jgi:hypothetical protein